MRKKSITLAAICSLLLLLNACKKDNKNVNAPATKATATQPLTTAAAVAGKWFVVKDSIQTSDYDTVLPSMRNISYSTADFVVFNTDNTGAISTQNAYNALYTNYPNQFVNQTVPSAPNLNFNYKVSVADNTLSIPKINSNIGIAYKITMLSATRMLLYTEANVVQAPHEYDFKQFIYLSK